MMPLSGCLFVESMSQPLELCFIGGGGCTLPMFFSSLYKNAKVEVVEVDPVVIEAATGFMGVGTTDCRICQVRSSWCLAAVRSVLVAELLRKTSIIERLPHFMISEEHLENTRSAVHNNIAIDLHWDSNPILMDCRKMAVNI